MTAAVDVDPLASFVESRDMPAEHRQAWDNLLANTKPYANEREIPPFRRPGCAEPVRRFVTAQLVWDADDTSRVHWPVGLWLYDGGVTRVVPLAGAPGDGGTIADTLLAHSMRGVTLVWVHGSDADMRAILRLYLPDLLPLGFLIEPGASGSSVRWLRISKGKHLWWWCDFNSVSGWASADWRELWPPDMPLPRGYKLTPFTGYHCLRNLAFMLSRDYGVSLRPTIAGAAIAALAYGMPPDLWIWKPPALLVAMCRTGGGFRGGYCYAQRYNGRARKWDVNRLYTWCLSQQLPARVAFGRYARGARRTPGIYMCTLSGKGSMPAYISKWIGPVGGWRKVYHHAGVAVCILATPEIRGLRDLGWTVEPAYGYLFTRTFTFAGYARKLERILATHGRDSADAKLARNMANLAYGKLAQDPQHDACVYALERPSAEWAPMLDNLGHELPNLWQRREVSYRAAQHIDVAATITAYGRYKLYAGFASVVASGGGVLYADTDSIVGRNTLAPPGREHPSDIGAWRYLGEDDVCIIIGRKQYAFGGEARLSGYTGHQARARALAIHSG